MSVTHHRYSATCTHIRWETLLPPNTNEIYFPQSLNTENMRVQITNQLLLAPELNNQLNNLAIHDGGSKNQEVGWRQII